MALDIDDPETETLARELAERTGETIAAAIKRALQERLARFDSESAKATLLEDLAAFRRRWAAMPLLDGRSDEEILGYDENGLPS